MQKTSRFVTIAALALTLGLGPATVHAQGMVPLTDVFYKVTNSSGSTIEYWCTGSTTTTDISHGSSSNFSCSGSFAVQLTASGATEYTVSHNCSTGQTQGTTASAGTSTGELSLSTSCVYGIP